MKIREVVRAYILPILGASIGSGIVGGVFSLLFIPRQYTASSLLFFLMRGAIRIPGVGELGQPPPTPSPYQVPVPADVAQRVLESRQVKEKVVERLRLREFFEADNKDDAVMKLEGATKVKVTREGMMEIKVTLAGTPQGLKRSRSGGGNPDDYQVRRMAARIANEYIKVLQGFAVDLMRSISTTETLFLAQRLWKAEEELKRAEANLAQFGKRTGILSAEEAGSAHHDLLGSLEKEKEQAQMSLMLTERRLKAARERLKTLPRISKRSETESLDPGVSTLISDLARAEVELRTAFRRFGPKHPKVKELETQVEELRRRIDEGKKYILSQRSQEADPFYQQVYSEVLNLELQRAGLKGKLAAIGELEKDLKGKSHLFPSLSVEERRLKRRLEIAESVYRSLRSSYETARTEVERPVMVFHVVDWAKPPERKSSPIIRQNVLIAFLVGGALTLLILLAQHGFLSLREE